MSEDEKLYKDTMKRMDELVEEVIQTCMEVADDNDYERAWVLDRFRSKFNTAIVRSLSDYC